MKHIPLLAFVLVCVAGVAAGVTTASSQPRRMLQAGDLDGLGAVPDWLRFYVQRALPAGGMTVWVPGGAFDVSSLVRVPRFPGEEIAPVSPDSTLRLRGVRNEQVSAQLAVAGTEALRGLTVSVSALRGPRDAVIPAGAVQVRFVGYVPIHRAHSELVWSARLEEVAGAAVSGTRNPDVVADPLVEAARVDVPALRAQPVWFTFHVPAEAAPGLYRGTVTVGAEGQAPRVFPLRIQIDEPVLPDPADYGFQLDVWMNPSAVAAWYGVAAWSDAHWPLLEAYLRDLAGHGQKKITTTIVDNPWPIPWLDGTMRAQTATPYASMVTWTRRTDGSWHFDYAIFDRYVETALRAGVGPAVGAYSLLTFRNPQRLTYYDVRTGETVTEPVEAGDARFRAAWTAFLQSFHAHLREKGWLDRIYLSFDERPPALMDAVLQLVKDAAPFFAERLSIAGSPDVDPYAADLALSYSAFPDQPNASDETLQVVAKRLREGRPTRFYTAGQPAHPNTLAFSPAVEARMLPWVALRYGLDGYLRWAYNDWPPDVFRNPVHFYVQGDEYFVYPGAEGPMSSIRWELLKDGIEDYELAHLLQRAGRLDEVALQRAASVATRSPDGREKDLRDLPRARAMLFE